MEEFAKFYKAFKNCGTFFKNYRMLSSLSFTILSFEAMEKLGNINKLLPLAFGHISL